MFYEREKADGHFECNIAGTIPVHSTNNESERLRFKWTDGRHFWPRRNFQPRRYCIKEVSNITTIELGKIIFAYLKLLQANASDMINESCQT